jgi:translation initiation factor 1
MARGQKLDLDIGAKFGDEWSYEGDTFREKNRTKKSTNNTIKPKNEHQLVFKYEKRRGKDVTLVGQFYLAKDEKAQILKEIKKRLGTGGSVKDTWIELQGKVDDKVKPFLQEKGWKFKK